MGGGFTLLSGLCSAVVFLPNNRNNFYYAIFTICFTFIKIKKNVLPITTQQNLALIETKCYKYLCVSQTKLKEYQAIPNRLTTFLETKSNQTIRLKSVTTTTNTDYYLEVKSPAKEHKEAAMKN